MQENFIEFFINLYGTMKFPWWNYFLKKIFYKILDSKILIFIRKILQADYQLKI